MPPKKPLLTDFLAQPVRLTDLLVFYRESDVSRPLYLSYKDLLAILTAAINGGSGTNILLQTNSVTNTVQDVLNLIEGTGITITDNGDGSVTFDATGGTYTVDNALTENVAGNFRLGGTLVQNTTITCSTFDFIVTKANSGTSMYVLNSSTGVGIFVRSIEGVAAQFSIEPAANTGIETVAEFYRGSQLNAGNGIYGAIDFYTRSALSSTPLRSGRFINGWAVAADAIRTSQSMWYGVKSGVETLLMSLRGSGDFKLYEYGVGNFVDTPVYLAGFLASGLMIEVDPAAFGTVTDVTATAPLTSSGGTTPDISTSMNTNKMIGRGSVGVGVMEEINVGAGLALSGTTLVATGSASGGSAISYFLNGGTAASVATYYQMSKTAVIGVGVDFNLAGNGLITQWLTDVGDPNRIEIPAGNWNFEIYMSASSAGGTPAFYVELLKYDGITFTTIANSSAAPEAITGGTLIELYLTALAVPYTTLLATDRLALRVYIVNSVGGRTITMHTQDSHLCEVITNFAGGVVSINGVGANTQFLITGTAGTDFNIDSTSTPDTHIFNLPTVSAANRGVLTSAQFLSLFAQKVWKSVATSSAITGSTGNNVVATELITAGSITVGDVVDFKDLIFKVGGNGVTTLRKYVNTVASLAGSPILIMTSATTAISQTFMGTDRTAQIKSATSTVTISATANIADDAIVGGGSPTSSNIDWTIDQYVIYTIQNGANADSTTLSYYKIEKQ